MADRTSYKIRVPQNTPTRFVSLRWRILIPILLGLMLALMLSAYGLAYALTDAEKPAAANVLASREHIAKEALD
ncbi:MAG: hypothetical protein K8I82_16815, partial [Anaerolineae bacterium]|nr:hypothetical protein [Anaerolineae bacterium]